MHHVTFGAGSTSCIDHFFVSPKLLPRLHAFEVQPLVGGGQPYPPFSRPFLVFVRVESRDHKVPSRRCFPCRRSPSR